MVAVAAMLRTADFAGVPPRAAASEARAAQDRMRHEQRLAMGADVMRAHDARAAAVRGHRGHHRADDPLLGIFPPVTAPRKLLRLAPTSTGNPSATSSLVRATSS